MEAVLPLCLDRWPLAQSGHDRDLSENWSAFMKQHPRDTSCTLSLVAGLSLLVWTAAMLALLLPLPWPLLTPGPGL
jgi:hypothetical protein